MRFYRRSVFVRQIQTHYYAEQKVDHKALELLMSKRDWIGGSGNIILDIDEDFFGVELPSETLVVAGLEENMTKPLQHLLSVLLCPKHIDHESLSNRMMREVIGAVVRRCRPTVKSDDDTCRVLIGEIRYIVRVIVLKHIKQDLQMFCSRETEYLLDTAKEITNVLYYTELDHLRILMEFGFCLATTPASLAVREEGHGTIGVCVGANEPNSTSVFRHKPDAAEVRARTTLLRQMLEIIDARHRPGVVTLCRSVRDGYTPRSLFSSIEANILGIFKDLPGHYDVVYDENLYGGKGGWPDRHKTV